MPLEAVVYDRQKPSSSSSSSFSPSSPSSSLSSSLPTQIVGYLMPFMEKGDLCAYLHRELNSPSRVPSLLTLDFVRRLASDIAQGLAYLHERGACIF